MAGLKRVVTASISSELASKLDEFAGRVERSRSWILRQAIAEWLGEEERRHVLTLESLKDLDEDRTFSQVEVDEHFAAWQKARRSSAATDSGR